MSVRAADSAVVTRAALVESQSKAVLVNGESVASGIDGGTSGEKGVSLSRTAVVCQRRDLRIDIEQIARICGAVIGIGGIADDVVAEGIESATKIGSDGGGVARNDRILNFETKAELPVSGYITVIIFRRRHN